MRCFSEVIELITAHVTNNLLRASDIRVLSTLVQLGLSAAFDTVDQGIMSQSLKQVSMIKVVGWSFSYPPAVEPPPCPSAGVSPLT